MKSLKHARRFVMNSAEKAAYAVGFHAGMMRATNREEIRHDINGASVSHCGCPICSFSCDACAEENIRQASEETA